MVKRIAAILIIFVCTSVAWVVLGSTIFYRTQEADASLKGRVASSWGSPQLQSSPRAIYEHTVRRNVEQVEEGRRIIKTVEERQSTPILPESSRVEAKLNLEPRQKGLLWYRTYTVDFSGSYVFRNTSGEDRKLTFVLPFPATHAIYDNLAFELDGQPLAMTNEKTEATGSAQVRAQQNVTLRVGYRSQGLDRWGYVFGDQVTQVRNFQLKVITNFKAVDFPENALSPTEKQEAPSGWELVWNYRNLVTGYQVGITLPERLQPGPLAGRISFFAPVSLFFFFFLMFILTTLREIELHPMNYFFLAGAFFSFHLLLAYLVDHISIHAAFVVCSLVSIFLVVSYLRLVVNLRFAAVEAGLAQLVYLVLFSYAFFFQGFTGLVVTLGSILTLFVVMQMTGRIDWAEKFARRPAH